MDGLDLVTLSGRLLGPGDDGIDQLFQDMLDVCATLGRADGIDERTVLKAVAIRLRDQHLPTLPNSLVDKALAGMEKRAIISEALHRQLLPVQEHIATLAAGAGDVIHTLLHESDGVCLELFHAEFLKIWPKLHDRVRLSRMLLDFRLAFAPHVARPRLLVYLASAGGLDRKPCRKYVGQLRAKAIAPTCDFFLRIVVVVAREQVAEHKLRHEDFVRFVDLDREALTVIPDLDPLLLPVNVDFDAIHIFVALQVVSRVNKDFVEDLIEGRNVLNVAIFHLPGLCIPYPQLVVLLLNGSDIRVGPQQDVLYLGFLLIDFLDGLASLQLASLLRRIALFFAASFQSCLRDHFRLAGEAPLHGAFFGRHRAR
mmetsp:Transcript_120270/g.345773  ORF Transcript_120270/g.345773 Transcript_120270/m.345773 type:complete len:369 (+) Transcript_120270:2876-3982(+)